MELVHVDSVGMEVTIATQEKPAVKNVLVVVDHFTQYVQAFVTRNHPGTLQQVFLSIWVPAKTDVWPRDWV